MTDKPNFDSRPTSTEWPSGLPRGQVVLRPRKSRPFLARHPWVLDSAVASVTGNPVDGDVVDLYSEQGGFIARGIYNQRSHVRVRLYTWDQNETLDAPFWQRRLATAIGWRRRLGLMEGETAARLVFSEADGLSGMVLDRFGTHVVLQVNSLAVAIRLPMLVPLIAELSQAASVTVRSEGGLAKVEGMEVPAECMLGQCARRACAILRERHSLCRRPGGGTEDRILPGSARESASGRQLHARSPRARSVLLQRRILTGRVHAGRRSGSVGNRLQRDCHPMGTSQCRTQWSGQCAV